MAVLSASILPFASVFSANTIAQQLPGQAFEISPPVVELKADPGESVNFNLKFRNITTTALKITSEVNDFVARGEDGQPRLLLDSSEQSSFTLAAYVRSIPNFKLEPQEQKVVKIFIDVPKDASPGGHYGVVRFTGTPVTLGNASAVALNASLGSLVLLNVSGDVKESLSFIEFSTSQNGVNKHLFEQGPLTFSERFQNTGNVHVKPVGAVRVTNLFGQEVAKLDMNDNGGNILPDSIRRFEQTFSKRFMFGKYKAEASAYYGQNNQLLTQTLTFWVIPYRAIGIAIAILFLLVLGARLLLARYKRRIINQASKNGGYQGTSWPGK